MAAPRRASSTLKGVSKGFGGRTVLPALDLELAPGERLGIVGPNGAGKTTLVRLILGELAPDSGTREVGSTVRFALMDQLKDALDPDQRVSVALAGNSEVVDVGGRTVRVESFLDRFGLGLQQQRSLVRHLSGGERSRLQLARLITRGGNVLVLDDRPTTSTRTLRALERVRLPGTALLVSHDRWFSIASRPDPKPSTAAAARGSTTAT